MAVDVSNTPDSYFECDFCQIHDCAHLHLPAFVVLNVFEKFFMYSTNAHIAIFLSHTVYEQSTNYISLTGLDVIHSHPLHWGDREMGTAISCTECSHMTGLIQKVVARDSLKAPSLHAVVLRTAVYERKIWSICKEYVGGW